MAIANYVKANFETLCSAQDHGQLASLECKRKSDGKIVTLVVAMNHEPGGDVSFVPLAEMIDPAVCNPYEAYAPPNEHGGFYE